VIYSSAGISHLKQLMTNTHSKKAITKATLRFCMPVFLPTHLYETTWLPLDGFPQYFTITVYAKICQHTSFV
jgi:hypothetical protein